MVHLASRSAARACVYRDFGCIAASMPAAPHRYFVLGRTMNVTARRRLTACFSRPNICNVREIHKLAGTHLPTYNPVVPRSQFLMRAAFSWSAIRLCGAAASISTSGPGSIPRATEILACQLSSIASAHSFNSPPFSARSSSWRRRSMRKALLKPQLSPAKLPLICSLLPPALTTRAATS